MKTGPLTEKQEKVYWFIHDYITNNGYAPTRQEIADYCKLSRQLSNQYVGVLIKKGYIKLTKHYQPRNLKIL